ncbi:MAG: hypothetical protein JW885_14265 [Deltaproteobacteria bacterium]|nr:hypothetical protein [Candidatus Zymogenaceae bacterium]
MRPSPATPGGDLPFLPPGRSRRTAARSDGPAALTTRKLDGIGIQRATAAGPDRDEERREYFREGVLVLLTARTADRGSY